MDTRLATMIQDVAVGAAGVFKGIGEDRQAVEGSFLVDRLGQLGEGLGKPGGVEPHGSEREGAEDVMEEANLNSKFCFPGVFS
jgi:hypothetical protein